MKNFIFIKNAVILTVTSFILRGLGLFAKVHLSNKIGAEGIGLYQLIFSVYVLTSTFVTAGVSTGVIRIVSDEIAIGTKESAIKSLKKCIFICVIWSISLGTIFYTASDLIGKHWINDVRTIPALKIAMVSLPFMSITSCIKGYFIAYRRTSIPSGAQILEQVIRIVLIFFIIDYFIPYGIDCACVAVIISDVLAEISSCFYSYVSYKKEKKRHLKLSCVKNKSSKILNKFISVVYPIALNKCLNTGLRTFENMLVPECLRKFTASRGESLAQFGMLKGMAMPILFFPASLLTAFATLLVPEMAEAKALGQDEKVLNMANKTFQTTMTISILVAGIFYIFSYELAEVIYNNVEVGFIIKVLAPLIPFMYLETVVVGILQGLNEQLASLKYNIFDSIIRITLIYLIVPYKGMSGFLFIMILSNIITSTLNSIKALNATKAKILWKKWIIMPLISINVSIFIMIFITNFTKQSAILYITTGTIVVTLSYFTILVLTKTLTIKLKSKSIKMFASQYQTKL